MEPTAGIEPATPCLQGRCYYQLSYVGKKVSGIHGWNRTNNLRFWRPSLCQLSYAYRKWWCPGGDSNSQKLRF